MKGSYSTVCVVDPGIPGSIHRSTNVWRNAVEKVPECPKTCPKFPDPTPYKPTFHTLHATPYTIHHAPYTIQHTPYTIHHTPYALHHTWGTSLIRNRPPLGPYSRTCLVSYGGPEGGTVSCERGSPVHPAPYTLHPALHTSGPHQSCSVAE